MRDAGTLEGIAAAATTWVDVPPSESSSDEEGERGARRAHMNGAPAATLNRHWLTLASGEPLRPGGMTFDPTVPPLPSLHPGVRFPEYPGTVPAPGGVPKPTCPADHAPIFSAPVCNHNLTIPHRSPSCPTPYLPRVPYP